MAASPNRGTCEAASTAVITLMAHERLWPDPQRGPWLLTPTFADVKGRIEVVGLQMRSLGSRSSDRQRKTACWDSRLDDELPVPLTPLAWRLPVAQLTSAMRASYLSALEESGLLAANPEAASKWVRPRRRGGVALERVAEVYIEASREGNPKPLEAVMRLGPMSKSAAAQLVSRACDVGLLVRQGRGKRATAPGQSSVPGLDHERAVEALGASVAPGEESR